MQSIVTKFIPCTNHKPSRVKAQAEAGSVTLSWDDNLDIPDNHDKAAKALRDKLGWHGKHYPKMARGSMPQNSRWCYVFVFLTDVIEDKPESNNNGVESIHISGKRWFQKSYGNTYFSAEISVNGKLVHRIDFQYGYGNHYAAVACDWLEANGYMVDREHYSNGSKEVAWRYFERKGVTFTYDATDVKRKKDL